jgi:hypothetical protein
MQVIWKAMHQDDCRFRATVLSRVNAMLASRHDVFYEIHL